ncbi:MAG: hypothetical protein IH984_02070 [Planctomycetes bacterium]|nr:hypothetical protein [Planctomycetota bacterium]
MRSNNYRTFAVFMLLVVGALHANALAFQDAEAADESNPQANKQATDEPALIRFNFKGASYDQVLDFFSRSTGLPVVKEADVPQGVLDYLAPEAYTIKKALEVLNILLQAKGVMLYVRDDMLYLQKLENMEKEAVPTFVGDIPDDVNPNDIITIVRPLTTALAKPLAEKLSMLVAPYGKVIAMEEQNSIVITETKAQIQRLLSIIEVLDGEGPEDTVEIIKLKHAKAEAIMVPLKALLSKRIEKYVTGPKGKTTKTTQETMQGLNISFDARTNTIIAKGLQMRIDKLKETIALIDVPSAPGANGRTVRTFALAQLSPAQAVSKLNLLFEPLKKEEKPTVIPLDEVGKITIVGTDGAIEEAEALLSEIDGGITRTSQPQRSIAAIPLSHADPNALADAVRSLLNGRQAATTKLVPGPDGKSLIVSGLIEDVAAVKALLPVLDTPIKIDRQVRLVTLTTPDPAATLTRARSLYDEQVDTDHPQWQLRSDLDITSRVLTLIGSSAAIDRFASALVMIESNTVVERQTRQYDIANISPSSLVNSLKPLASQLLTPRDGMHFIEPTIEAIDQLNQVIVTALPSQFATLDSLITTLDKRSPNDYQFRVIPVGGINPQQLMDKANFVFQKRVEGLDPQYQIAPSVEFDSLTGNLLVSGTIDSVKIYEQSISEARRLLPPARTGRIIQLRTANAESIVKPLLDLFAKTTQIDPSRTIADPTIQVIDHTNSLYIIAEPQQFQILDRLVQQLDKSTKADHLVRLLRLTAKNPIELLARTQEIYAEEVNFDHPQWKLSVDYDEQSRELTLIGSTAALDRFSNTMRLIESNTVVDQETRQYDVTNATPSKIISPLNSLSKQMLQPRDGSKYTPPTFEAVDQLDLLIVTAVPEQFATIDSLIATLDERSPEDYQFRVIAISGSDPQQLMQKADYIFTRRTEGFDPDEMPSPTVDYDALTGNLLVSGNSASVRTYEQSLSEARKLLPPARTGRLIELRSAKASDVIVPLEELIASTAPVDPSRTVPPPTIALVERTNSLYVVGEAAQLQMVERYVKQLDTFELTDLPPLRLIQVRAADAVQLASMLRKRYDARPTEQRREMPVTIDTDSATNTLIVTTHQELYDEIKEFVDSVNRSGDAQAERETMIFPLKLAKAADLAKAMDKLYPQPPMPVDRRGRPLPHLREPKEVYVTAEPATNTLIIEAPSERRAQFEALVQQLDRVELPPTAELRTYHIERGDPAQIARTLTELARQNVMNEQPSDGSKPVAVSFQAEPISKTLIVAGDHVTFEKTELMLRDLQAIPIKRSLRVIEVTGADPQELADRALRLYKEQTADIPDATEVSIEVDHENSSLLVVAEDEAMLRFTGIFNQLQQSIGPPPEVRLITLEYVDATEVVTFVTDLTESELATTGGQTGPKPILFAIERTNSVLIAARREQHEIIRALIQSLDKPADQEMPPLRILQLRNADAVNLASALMRQYNQRPAEEKQEKPVNIAADPQTNTLIIAAHPDMLPQIQAIVEDLNNADRMDTEGREIQIFPLKVARAEELAKTIDEMYPQPPMPRDSRGRPRPDLQQPREVVVRADPQTNSLIVDAPSQRMAGFEKLVEQLDRQKIVEEIEVRTYQVIFADLNGLAKTLRDLAKSAQLGSIGSDRRVPINISTEPVSKTLIVSGPSDIFPTVEKLLKDLDIRRAGPATSLKFFKLQNARADTLAPMLREILMARIAEDVPEAGSNIESLLNVTADRKTNTLIISAPEALMPVAEETIRQLDSGTALLGDPIVRIKPLTFADAREVSQALSQAIRSLISKATGDPIDVKILTAPGANALILVGLEADLAEVELLIEPLDARPSMDAIDARTFKLKYAEAIQIAPVVERLLTDQQETDPRILLERIRRSRGQIDLTPKVRVEADERTNSLIVSGPQRTVALAETLITQLDQPDESAKRIVETYTPTDADPIALAQIVRQVVDTGRAMGRRNTLKLITDPKSGAVVVAGTDEEVADALTLLAEWDRNALKPPQIDLQVITLAHTQASVVAQALSPILRDRSRWPQQLQAIARAGISIAQPTVTADAIANRLLISAPTELLPMARQFIAELDQPRSNSGTVDVRIFNLTKAQAADVAAAVQSALAAKSLNEPGTQPATITAEPSSNSIIVTANPDQLTLVESIIASLDSGVSLDQPQVRTVFLKHARAETIAPIVQQMLAPESDIDVNRLPNWMLPQLYQAQLQQGGEPRVRVAADTRLNAVVISGPPTSLDVAEQMVAQLDIDPAGLDSALKRSVRVLVIENADPAELATNLQAIFQEQDQLDAPPTIRVDTASNSLLVRATNEQFETIERVVKQIDNATLATARQMQLIAIDPSKASASEMAQTLQRMLGRRGSSKVQVISLEELLKRRSLRKEPQPQPGPSSALPMSLWPTIAAQVFAVQDVTNEDLPQQAGRAAIEDLADVTIAVDPETNSLIIVGSPRAIERIIALVEQLESQLPAAPSSIHYVGLPQAVDAKSISTLIDQTLRRMTPAGGKPGDLRRRVAVIADITNNALIIACNDIDFEVIGDLIAALSQPASVDKTVVKIYSLKTITAERAAESVRQMIAPDSTSRGRGKQAQRMRDLAIKLLLEGQTIEAIFDPNRVRISADSHTNSLIVIGPAEAIGFVDQFIELLDQTRVNTQTTLKLYTLKNAKADELSDTLRKIFLTRFQSMKGQLGPSAIQPEFAVDKRTNTLLVTAAPEQLAEVDTLLQQLDQSFGVDRYPLQILELKAAMPQQAAEILEKVVIGTDQKRRAETLIVADDATGSLLVRASEEVLAEINEVLNEIDRRGTNDYKVRTITLERADASSIAAALQNFYDDRAKISSTGRGRRAQTRRVSIIGDTNSNTVLIAASDEDFEEIKHLIAQFDSEDATQQLEFRVFPLKHAKANDVQTTLQRLVNDLMWNQNPFMFFYGPPRGGGQSQKNRDIVAIRADERLNALIVTGQGDKFALVESLIEVLDAPPSESDKRIVKLYRVENADLDVVADVILDVFTDTSRSFRWWQRSDPHELKVRKDEASKILIISGSGKEQNEVAELIASIDSQVAPEDQQIETVPVEFAQARDLARTLSQFLEDRAQAINAAPPTATITSSESANMLIISANRDDHALLKDLLSRLDQPDSGDRIIEIIALKQEATAEELARIISQQFEKRGGQGVRVTADVRTNSLIVNAPKQQFAQAKALIDKLDQPEFSEETIIRTYPLEGARAEEVMRILQQTLELDASGETKGKTFKIDEDSEAVEVNAKIVADERSNSLVVTATIESFPVIESLIEKLENIEPQSPLEFRIIPLEHARAFDVYLTLMEFTRQRGGDRRDEVRIDWNTAENRIIINAIPDQIEQLLAIVEKLDQPSGPEQIREFIPLQFAEAEKIQEALAFFYGPNAPGAETPGERNVQIVADPASNSLVISASEEEWVNVRALLTKLDSEEYDASLQIRVMPLMYADARSVARAINDAFQGQVERDRRGQQSQRNQRRGSEDDQRRDEPPPTRLVESEEWVRAAAEPQTNSVIVSASRQNMRKIEQIIEQIDVADYTKLPPPQLIPVINGDPLQLAATLNELYEQTANRSGRRAMSIVGSATSNTVIVRAKEEDFAQIKVLAEALQQAGISQGLSVHVLKLTDAPATRVASAIEAAFQAKAQQTNQPLAIHADAPGNSLIIACTAALFAEIEKTVSQLDALMPPAGHGIFIIELENISPDEAKNVIETIGLHQRQPDDSVSRIVTEPIKVAALVGRNAIIVVANPIDRQTIVGLLKSIDIVPDYAQAQTRIVTLKNAEAEAVENILRQILSPTDQQTQTSLAKAVQEQVRRLSIRRDGPDAGVIQLDLTKPIRIIADTSLNALVISSTEQNVYAMTEIIKMFDRLPITDAVTVQLFPLENIAADQFARIVNEIFDQGKQLGRVPGTNLEGIPEGQVGPALLDEIAISVDERTNTVIVAGKAEAVALVDVLARRIDADVTPGWIEPRIVQLRFADANDLAETLQAILVDGVGNLPQSTPLQKQIGRIRVARMDENGGAILESDVFTPMTRLVIRPESQLNALILVGTPMNLEVVSELIRMLDIEAAAPGASVRIYPVAHASASRLATTLTRLFDQQVQSKAIRQEDKVIALPDERTNTLIVTTSPRSFIVLERLLETLDSAIAPELSAIRRIKLKNASASRIATIVNKIMDARLDRLREIEPETADLQKATIIEDSRTNSLIIAAGNESYEVIERLVIDLDTSDLPEVGLLDVITLTTANIERIADTINEIMERRYADMPAEIKRSQQPLIMTDARTNSLLIAANLEDLTAIRELVAKLEATQMDPAVGLHVLPLEGARAELLAPRLEQLMRERQQSLGDADTPMDRVTIEADIASNSLIVAANDENLQVIRDLINALITAESQAEGDSKVEIIQLTKSRAVDIVETLEDLYVDEVNRTKGENTIRLTVESRLNAVLVNAPPADIKEIKSLVAMLDNTSPSTVVEIKYIPLSSANALETVSLIENVLSGRGLRAPRRGSQQATVLKYLREIVTEDGETGEELTEMESSAAIRESIALTPDLRTNTIIVHAPRESMRMIEMMIRDLDDSSSGDQNIRIFSLKNADALAMAQILTDLFNLRQQGNLYVLKPREYTQPDDENLPGVNATQGTPTLGGLADTDLTAVPDDRKQLSITVDTRTNSLLVSGTPIYLDLVSTVVKELDALEANEREIYVYPLRNAVAGEVARVLTQFIESEQRKLIGTIGVDQLGSAARLLEREVTIVGDDQSNTVLISASPRYMDQVKAMIAELDVDPPQVLIQVMLAEVTLDTSDDWGIDFGGSRTEGDVNISGGFSLVSAFASGMGVPNLAVSGTDFNLLLRALRGQGRLQVLSNPSVMAANNQPAFIQVGETIRLPVSTSFDRGSQQSSVVPEDIGILLEVTPSINPDGYVRMTIKPEISELSARTTQITESLSSPIITRRTADTTVTVRDGQTIILGGLISDRYESREQKVPLLGDIPIIGKLFTSTSEKSTKTELLIVLTPHVIMSPTELDRVDRVTIDEINRLSLPDKIKDQIRQGIIDGTGGLYDRYGNRLDVPRIDTTKGEKE